METAHAGQTTGNGPVRTRMWRNGDLEAENFPIAELGPRLRETGTVVWLDLLAPADTDLRLVTDELGLSPVAVEDSVTARERVKLDRYRGYVFLNLYAPETTRDGLVLHEISAFVTERALVTVRERPGFDVDALVRRWDEGPRPLPEGAAPDTAPLVHGLLDLVVDLQLDTVQALDGDADTLEELIFDDAFPVKEIQRRSFRLRKDLIALRRVALPMREIVDELLRRPSRLVPDALVPDFQDVYDHTLRVAEWTDELRDLVANLLDSRIALQGNRMNEVMKKVTSWAAIIAVPTAITGFYGQNLPVPGFERLSGLLVSTGLIVGSGVALYAVFKVRDWL
ncbi:magnesium transporter CorA family protein [Actinomadura rugatobispora]|uniref:Magnesium transporter CorA family protein n=1 Tax=Actinomadura rugatobispora TaxID=1994 RepID=A0ABW0ZNF6_9ACTN|nr:magnesium transporter CorA family protein [Actinomadura rugatobispora]